MLCQCSLALNYEISKKLYINISVYAESHGMGQQYWPHGRPAAPLAPTCPHRARDSPGPNTPAQPPPGCFFPE